MSTSYQHSDDMSGLYEASSIGCVDTLNQLLHQNPQILHKISLTSFTETPLHISSLLGHLDFTKALLSHKPQLALELNSSRSTPLHLASAEGHIQIVKELVGVNEEACLVGDEEGRIPLHYAAMRGRMEVVRELVRAKPESLSLRDNINGNTTLHFCVIYNHLETLKAIVELLEPERSGELLNYTNSDGKNTILHLAVMFKQVEYLLTIPEIRSEARSMKNERGYTVHEMLERSPKDMKSLRIQLMFINYNIIDQSQTPEPTRDVADDDEEVERPRENNESNCCVIRIYKSIVNWFRPKDMDKWFKEMKSNLSVVAILISTLSF
ncbi:ankyrin repeat-containing protein [Senna tora]|uniref:Ankyrin repeat-containing protein n=1 Tax=Senna tora TaxID=362788 RepID=A0A835CIH5_9FABA|nr:ankyrin repeat-containing protein [Senna tora]